MGRGGPKRPSGVARPPPEITVGGKAVGLTQYSGGPQSGDHHLRPLCCAVVCCAVFVHVHEQCSNTTLGVPPGTRPSPLRGL